MTINIYDAEGGGKKMELLNNGENDKDIMPIVLIDANGKKEHWFNISKDDARDVIKYFKREFKFTAADF